jgi:hypothetical protein
MGYIIYESPELVVQPWKRDKELIDCRGSQIF